MARTLEEIIEIIETKAAEFPELEELKNNPSAMAVWDMSNQVVAFAIRNMEEIIDAHKLAVAGLIVSQENGRISWYHDRILEYQHGDIFSLVNNVIKYQEVIPEKRIVTHCAIKQDDEQDGKLIVRVAKDSGDNLTQLEAEELAGLGVYVNAFKFAGITIDLDSLPPDEMAYNIEVEVDQSVINLQGENIDGSSSPVLDAIKEYHKNIGEAGIIYLSKVVDAIQAIPGIIDVHINTAQYYDGNGWVSIERKWESPATYSIVNEDETLINYS